MVDLKKIPSSPGVYLMKNNLQQIIYIGKAKNLHKRVSSYFREEQNSVKTKFLVEKIDHIDFITTNNDKDALILENQLIKKHLPYYNINLKDGKSYTRLAIDYNNFFPKIYVTRENSKKNVRYFGPYPSAYNTRSLTDIAEKLFFLRRCKVSIKPKEELTPNVKPCILYHLKKCYGACIWKDDEKQYKARLKRFIAFLNGQFNKIRSQLEKEMKEHITQLNFEQAAKNRDLINAITEIEQEQKVYFQSEKIVDLLGYYNQDNHHSFVILRFNKGQLVHKRVLNTESTNDLQDIIEKVLETIYVQEVLEEQDRLKEVIFTEKNSLELDTEDIANLALPNEIVFQDPLNTAYPFVENLFSEFYNINNSVTPHYSTVQLNSLKHMAFENAQAEWKAFYKVTQTESALLELKRILDLQTIPINMETYDISNVGDHFAVGSCVSFRDGLPNKKNYRYFKIKYIKEQNDFAMMQETLLRRFKLDMPLPDLIIIDGGKGQVSAALEIFKAMKIEVPFIGLAKKEELLILPDHRDPITLSHNHPALKIIMHTRDEAHRFANKLRSKMMSKKITENTLDSIKGLSALRKKKIVEEFGSIDALVHHTAKEIKEKTGVPLPVIENILLYLKS